MNFSKCFGKRFIIYALHKYFFVFIYISYSLDRNSKLENYFIIPICILKETFFFYLLPQTKLSLIKSPDQFAKQINLSYFSFFVEIYYHIKEYYKKCFDKVMFIFISIFALIFCSVIVLFLVSNYLDLNN